jgi:hypothetical protein
MLNFLASTPKFWVAFVFVWGIVLIPLILNGKVDIVVVSGFFLALALGLYANWKRLKLWHRWNVRLGTFSRERRNGFSVEQARHLTDIQYPPTQEDLEYEYERRIKDGNRSK